MNVDIEGNPEYGALRVDLAPGETIIGESGAMSYMSDGMEVRSKLLGGFFKAIWRRLVARESLLVAEFFHASGGSITLSPATPGTILHRKLEGESLILTRGTFLAATPGVQLATRFAGLRGFFSGEGGFFMEASGHGDLFFSSYGAVIEREVEGALVVDTGHVVAWEENLSYTVGGMGSLKSTLFSGEGLTLRFSGRGRIWLQTRTLPGTASWLVPYLPS